jgi:RNA polymerase subunit RPABC4/transcription elongation factor Spt4
MRRKACPQCGTSVDLKASSGVCPNCQFHLASKMEQQWTRWVIVFLVVLVLGVVAQRLLPSSLGPIALGVLLLGGGGLIVSLWRRTTYRLYYDPDYASGE